MSFTRLFYFFFTAKYLFWYWLIDWWMDEVSQSHMPTGMGQNYTFGNSTIYNKLRWIYFRSVQVLYALNINFENKLFHGYLKGTIIYISIWHCHLQRTNCNYYFSTKRSATLVKYGKMYWCSISFIFPNRIQKQTLFSICFNQDAKC